MKKMMIALMALFCLSCFAEKLYVYDFTASFKRIDTKKVLVKDATNSDIRAKLDSPKVVSDKFTGYLVIEACEACNGEMVDSLDPDNVAVLYLVRKGDTQKRAYRTQGNCEIAVFGAKSGVILAGAHAGEMLNYGKLTEAQIKLEAPFSFELIDGIGFMGNRTFTDGGLLQLRGFGKASNTKWTEGGDCLDTTYYCLSLKNASGDFIMDYSMSGACADFLFDLCSAPNAGSDSHAYGAYSIRFNSALSKKAGSWVEAEQAVMSKLNVNGIYGINNEFTEEVGLAEAQGWMPVSE